jgi:hypothetical protein
MKSINKLRDHLYNLANKILTKIHLPSYQPVAFLKS